MSNKKQTSDLYGLEIQKNGEYDFCQLRKVIGKKFNETVKAYQRGAVKANPDIPVRNEELEISLAELRALIMVFNMTEIEGKKEIQSLDAPQLFF